MSDEPRKFWIAEANPLDYEDTGTVINDLNEITPVHRSEFICVVEYSAYLSLKAQLTQLKSEQDE